MTLAAASAPIERTTCAQLSISADGAVRSTRFDDFYFRPGRGVEEARYVFLQGNQLEQRWRAALPATATQTATPNKLDGANLPRRADHFSIAETGFGSGLNFLATLELWCSVHQHVPAAAQPTLYYYGTEKYPLTHAALAKVLDHYNPLPDCANALLQQYPDAIGGDYLLRFDLHGCRVYLILLFGDSLDALNRLEHYPLECGRAVNPAPLAIDAWYLDGFAPPANPAMWRADLFTAIGRHSRHGSSAATFSAARAARDGLAAAGFKIAVRAGFARKREMLTAQFTGSINVAAAGGGDSQYYSLAPCYARAVAAEAPTDSPVDSSLPAHRNASAATPTRTNHRAAKTALVIGAGIAGCSTAAMLAQRGWQVTIVDQHASLAAGASGNRAAILYARTASQRAGLADFYEASFHYAANFYQLLGATSSSRNLANGLRGMLMLGQQLNSRWQANNPETASRRNVDAAEASALAGIALKKNGIYYPHSGYLRPLEVCQALLDTPAITFVGAQAIDALEQHEVSWRATGAGNYTFQSDVVVIACGTASHRFAQCQWLPLKALRGQTTDLPSHGALAPLKIALCEKGYCTPALADPASAGEPRSMHSVGATYNPDFHGDALRALDHRDNIDKLTELLGFDPLAALPLNSRALAELGGRASARCVAPDYLPMVGSVVDRNAFLKCFSSLRDNARRTPSASAPHLQGLYVNTAYGSHGFTMAPLASEILAAEIDAAPFPIGDTLRQALSPSRFLVRQLIKSKSATRASNAGQRSTAATLANTIADDIADNIADNI